MVDTSRDFLSLSDISMTFDQVTVLHNVSLQVRRGEVHALLGQNGSGKSTLIKILSGFYSPNAGASIEVLGEKLPAVGPGEAARHGIAFVHQDLGLVGSMSIADNLAVGRYAMKGARRIDWRTERARACALLAEFGLALDVTMNVDAVPSQAERALIAIARAVESVRGQSGAGLLVLDEPTAYLPHGEVVRLQKAVRALAATGIAVIYVTHKLDELPGFADRATILRDGHLVTTVNIEETEPDHLVSLMIGHELEASSSDRVGAGSEQTREPVLVLDGLSGRDVQNLSLSVGRGEIVGLTGLVGMGQEEVASLVFGAIKATTGIVSVDGHEAARPTPRSSIDGGVVFIPANRVVRGVSTGLSLAENVSLPALGRYFRRGRIRRRLEIATVRAQLLEFHVTPAVPTQAIGTLSGGNQQKAVLAKWLQLEPRLVLVDEPTQGIDVGTREEVLARLRALAQQGAGVLMSSSEHEDLLAVCHRVLVFRNGCVVAELHGSRLSKESLLRHSSYDVDAPARAEV